MTWITRVADIFVIKVFLKNYLFAFEFLICYSNSHVCVCVRARARVGGLFK